MSEYLHVEKRFLDQALSQGGSGVVLNIWRFVTGYGKFLGHASKFCRPAKRSTR
jgi:hypothetical protein